MPMYTDWGTMGWMAGLMLLVPLSLVGLVAALFVWAIRTGGRGDASRDAAEPPLVILQRRYARGDIGADEYERMRVTLSKT